MIKNLFIVDDVNQVEIPNELGQNQYISKIEDFELIMTYEKESERIFGGAFEKFNYQNCMFVSSTLSKWKLKYLIKNYPISLSLGLLK